jgi:hypothetical protein
MSKVNGFLPLRRGIWEHVRDGSLTPIAALAYIFMLSEADTRTGIWKGSAQCIATALRIPKSTAKYILKCLDGRYIRRFSTPGKHFCYPILLHRFVITQGQHVGLMLDAINSANERELEFFEHEELPASSPELVQHVGPQRRKENREKTKEKRNHAAKPAPPVDCRQKSVFDSCYEAYRLRFSTAPTWAGREAKALQRFLRDHLGISAEEIVRRFGHLLSSSDRYHAEKHGSPLHLLSNFDTFADGPILAAPQKGGANGKQTGSDLAIQNARALGLGCVN